MIPVLRSLQGRPYVGCVLALGALCAACGEEAGLPIARIDLEPTTICEGEAEQLVRVSGGRSESAERSSDGLRWAWSFSVDPVAVVEGSLEDKEVALRFSAHAPIAVHLAVTDARDRTALRSQILGLTQTSAASCDRGCLEGEVCAPLGGRMLCAPDLPCSGDAECGCLACRADDLGTMRCLPRVP